MKAFLLSLWGSQLLSAAEFSEAGIVLRLSRTRCPRSFHPVPALSLGGIESFVSAAQERFAIRFFHLTMARGSKSEAESNRNLVRIGFDRLIGNAVAQTLCADEHIMRITTREDDQEFFPTIAPDRVVKSNVRSQPPTHFLQDDIAYKVAVRVIDFLKVIDVGHDHTERVSGSFSPQYFSSQQIEDGATIPKPGERIVSCRRLQIILGLYQGRL